MNGHSEQFIVLDLEGIETGHPNLKSSDPLRKRKLKIQKITRRIVGGRIFEVVVPEKPDADLGSVGENRRAGIGDCARRAVGC